MDEADDGVEDEVRMSARTRASTHPPAKTRMRMSVAGMVLLMIGYNDDPAMQQTMKVAKIWPYGGEDPGGVSAGVHMNTCASWEEGR